MWVDFSGLHRDAGYSVTSVGVSCAEKRMAELDDETECKSAARKVVPNSSYGFAHTMRARPPGCYYRDPFYHPYPGYILWNKYKNGKTCRSCISICKGEIFNSLYPIL